MTDPLAVIRAALESTEYSCPGGHRKDGQRGDVEDLIDALMTAHGLPDDWDEDRLRRENVDLWRIFRKDVEAAWFDEGACQGFVTMDLEWDGDEYTQFCYPVASGECAVALGLDEMSFGEHSIFSLWWERYSLLKTLRAAERVARDERLLILETAS